MMYSSDAIGKTEDVLSECASQADIPTLLPADLSDRHDDHDERRPPPRYDSFDQAPGHLKCRSQWKRLRRKVKPDARPTAAVAAMDRRYDIGLYPESATVPYQPTALTLARWRYFDLFVRRTQGDRRIFWDKNRRNPSTGLPGVWTTHRDRLRDADIRRHLGGKDVFGVRAGSKDAFCHFFDLDLDCHPGADKDIFRKMLRVLLGEFYGENAFHVEVADERAQGVHLRQVFHRARTVEQVLSQVRLRLARLDRRHPELIEEAVGRGVKPFSRLEVFPNPSCGVRLPLCVGRTVLLDKPLASLFDRRRGRKVADVVGFVSWVDDPLRAYMSVDDVMEYVAQRLSPVTTLRAVKVTAPPHPAPEPPKRVGRASGCSSVPDLHPSQPKRPPEGVFELAQRQLYPSLAEIAVKGLVPVERLRVNGKVPDGSALATVCVSFAMALWHEELFHLPEKERHHKITNLLVDWVFANHNGVCSRLNTEDTKGHADVIKQVYNCVTSASRAKDHEGYFAEVRRKKAEGLYKHEISLVKLLAGKQEEVEERSTYCSVSDSQDDSPLPDSVLAVLEQVKPKTRYKPFFRFSTRVLNHLKRYDGVARLSQEQGFVLLGYTNANQFTKYRDLLVKAGLLVLAQESVAHWRPNTYALTSQARDLFGLASKAVRGRTKHIKCSDDEVVAALTTYPDGDLFPAADFDPQEAPGFEA